MQLLVRNRVKDFATWQRYFLEDTEAAQAYGVTLAFLWQSADDPNNVFFLLNIEDVERTNQFMSRPESQEIGEKSGVIDADLQFLEAVALH